MKTILLCLISLLVVIGLQSCKKEQSTKISSIQILSEQDLKFENQILAFKIRMTSSFKSTDSISVDSTIW